MSQRVVYSITSFIHVQTACAIQYSTMFEVHYDVYVLKGYPKNIVDLLAGPLPQLLPH